MNTLFILLFFVSVVFLVLGLIKPSIFTKVLGPNPSGKQVLIKVGLVTLVLFILGGVTLDSSSNEVKEADDINSQEVMLVNEENEQEEAVEQENIEPYVDAEDFKIKNYSTILSKYGEPSWKFDEEAPVYTNFGYETNEYDLQSNFLSNDKRVFSFTLFIKSTTCNYKDFSFDTAKKALSFTNSENLSSEDWSHDESASSNRYELNNVNGWDNIYIDCNYKNQFSISYQAIGWER